MKRSEIIVIIHQLERRMNQTEFVISGQPSDDVAWGWRCGYSDALDDIMGILLPAPASTLHGWSGPPLDTDTNL